MHSGNIFEGCGVDWPIPYLGVLTGTNSLGTAQVCGVGLSADLGPFPGNCDTSSTLCLHGSRSGFLVGRYYEPSVPHIYPEVWFTGFTECSYLSAKVV